MEPKMQILIISISIYHTIICHSSILYGQRMTKTMFFIASFRAFVKTDCWKDIVFCFFLSHDSVWFTVNHPPEPADYRWTCTLCNDCASLHLLCMAWHKSPERGQDTSDSGECQMCSALPALRLSEVGNTSSLGVLGDCLSVAATQHRPKDVLDKIDELWDQGREWSAAPRIRHAIILLLNDAAAISRTVAAN